MMKILLFSLVIMICSLNALATTRYVSATGAGQYTTLNAAATAAVSGDTILVGPGTYSTAAINEANKRLTYIGAGWDQTIVNLGSSLWEFNGSGANRSSVEGMRILSSSDYTFAGVGNPDSVSIRRVYFVLTNSGYGISWSFEGFGANGRSLLIEDCIILSSQTGGSALYVTSQNYPTTIRNTVFVNQGGGGASALQGTSTSGTVELYNCVFLNWRTPFNLSSAGGPVIAVNNFFYDWLATPSMGSYNPSSIWDYNACATGVTTPGTNGLAIESSPFVNYDEALNYQIGITDLNLDPTNGAAFIDSGHPVLLDFTDGTRSDRGVYGGPKPLVDNGVPNYPWAVNIVLNPNLVGVGTPVNATALGRVGPQY
jgi:hypothetical protein